MDGLRLAAERDEPFLSKPSEMLRKRRLAELQPLAQLAHGQLSLRCEVAQDEQPLFVGQRFEQRSRVGGLCGEVVQSFHNC